MLCCNSEDCYIFAANVQVMKKILFASLLLLAAVVSQAQTASVTGVILDSLTRESEAAAVVQFFKVDDPSKPIAYTTTDQTGRFTHAFSTAGTYRLHFNNMGRKQVNINFTLEVDTVQDLGVILVEDDVQSLKAGTVVAQKTLVVMEVDKLTYKVEDDVDSKTSTVLDMLRKVPMVSVDGMDNITVNGSSNFKVYVDGRPNSMMSSAPAQIFKSMPASFVKKIEVVTNPGARYDAEGVGGVLNITTITDKHDGTRLADGQYGTVNAKGTTRGGGGGVFYTMQRGKFAFSLNGNAMYNVNKDMVIDVERVQILENGNISTNSHSETDVNIPMYSGTVNLSYEIDSLNLITASAGVMHFGMESEGLSSTHISSDAFELSYGGETYNKMTRNDIDATVNYQHTSAVNPERRLALLYQFVADPSVNNTANTFNNAVSNIYDLTDRRTDALVNSATHTVQADFTTPVAAGHFFNLGAKYIARHNYSDQQNYLYDGNEYLYDELGSMKYDFYNNIGAAYAEYEGKTGRLGYKVGARYEHTWQNVRYSEGDGEDFRLNYGNLVPNASVQLNINRQQNVGLSYNMRISRPGITYLNPYVNTSDPTALSYGNTNLKTEMAHNVNLVYNYFSQKWIMNLTLRDTFLGNGVSGYSFYALDGLLHSTYGNIVQSNNIGANLFITWMPGNKTRVIFNGGGGYNTFLSRELSQKNDGFDYNAMLGFQQTLPWDLRFSANVIMTGRSVNLQGWHSGMALGTAGLTKSILDDRLTFSISGATHLTGGNGMRQITWTQGPGFTNKVVNTIKMQTLTFDISFSFGKQDNAKVKTTRKTITNDAQLNTTNMAEGLGTMMRM